ncbi:MAG: 2-hydroxyacid dehydrogenase [Luteolibacter sp.]
MICAVFDAKPYDREFLNAGNSGDIDWRFLDFRLGPDTVKSAEGADAVCVFVNDVLDRGVIEELAAFGIRHVALRCAGFNNVDLDAAKEHGLSVTRVPAYSPHAVAEHTLALLLTLNRKIHRAYNRVREQNFSLDGLVGFDLYQKTVGVIGTGKIGRITAELFRGFGCKVLAYDVREQSEWAEQHQVRYAQLDEILETSDVVSLHCPLFPETFHLLDEAAFRRMKKGAYLVNTSRGKLVDSKALIEALKRNHLGGVALDVYEVEEGIFFEDHSAVALQDDDLSRLLTFPNVLITSHQAFLTREALSEIARVTVLNLRAAHEGEECLAGSLL